MKIEVKYNLREELWTMKENKPIKVYIQALKIESFYNGYTGDNWGDESAGKGRGWPINIYYNTECYGKEEWIHEDKLFKTKEELLESL